MKIQELFEASSSEEDKAIRKLIDDYKDGNGDCRFPCKFPVFSVKNGKVIVKKKLELNHCMYKHGELMIPLAQTGQLVIHDPVKSFKNFPDLITNITNMGGYAIEFLRINANITSFEGCPSTIEGNANFQLLNNVSYSKISQHIKTIDGWLSIWPNYEGPLLDVLNISSLLGIEVIKQGRGMFLPKVSPELFDAVSIINKYLGTSNPDVLQCKEELIDKGLKIYAKI